MKEELLNLEDYNEVIFYPEICTNCDENMNYIPARETISDVATPVFYSSMFRDARNSDLMEDISPHPPVLPASYITEWRNSNADSRSSLDKADRFSVESRSKVDRLSLTQNDPKPCDSRSNPFEQPSQATQCESAELPSLQETDEQSLSVSQPVANSTMSLAKGCNCKKSRCLKLYCECFVARQNCSSLCNCLECHNTVGNEEEIREAIRHILKKKPMSYKVMESPEAVVGCNCKRSFCQSLYCFCHKRNMKCTPMCKCSDCENQPTITSQAEAKAKLVFNLKSV
eukprot:TRINITY_DN3812_c0_g1_i11.p1 TRINITY_DN3812_c0_g1~~TRINITY_DN3812_c0_g1_i11.p1  ORF type:complete len:285 (+),score=32.98 TRINITY_DN3812_c0_g1_i11:80-934(+)